MEWAAGNRPSFVCFANVHMTIEAYKAPSFRDQLNNASLVVTDGKPLTVACYSLYRKKQERIAGMDFMPAVLKSANEEKSTIFLYGSKPDVLEALTKKIAEKYPAITIGGAISPPFRPLLPEEEEEHIRKINDSGARLVFVSLGCPKQEKWMAAHYKKINAVLLGVGGAFAVTAGLQRRSPKWMQNLGLEWFHRLMVEPRRMFRRYFETNFAFLYLMGVERFKQLMK
jgi:N-acetylglucosaminyldiphosphoundecaprenol N-acetyl-beta-D-mannosaminyltransferase